MSVRAGDPVLFAGLQRALVGRYSLEREVGAGGMGVVYLARDVRHERAVAIKLLRPALAARPDARTRFLAEARLAAGLAHPNIVPIHEVEERGDLLWYVMAFVQGRSLGERLRTHGPLPPSEMGRVLREVAWALSYAHGRDIVHRDIKPDNIFLEEGGRVLVLDFGIAQRTAEIGEAIGTLGFLPPEQRQQGRPDPRSDLYSLGITAAAALRARVPASSQEAAAWIREGAPWAATLLCACLETDPAHRPGSARQVADGLIPPIPQPIHPDIRRWVGEADALRAIGWGWSVFFAIVALITAPIKHQGLGTSLFFTLLAWPFCGAVRFWQTRRVLAAGHQAAALPEALVEHAAARRQELRRRVRPGALPLGVVIMQAGATFFGLALMYLLYDAPAGFVEFVVFVGLIVVAVGGLLNSAAPARAPKQDAVAERRVRFWTGSIGRWILRLARVGLGPEPGARRPPVAAVRPTEMLLGDSLRALAVELPGEVREQFTGLEATIDRLERGAARLTERRQRLEAEATADPRRAAALRPLLESIRTRREEALAALDALRRSIMAVRGGTGDLAPLTLALEDALELAERVNRLAEARNELRM